MLNPIVCMRDWGGLVEDRGLWLGIYPLVMTNIATGNDPVIEDYPIKMQIFYSYVELPEGIFVSPSWCCRMIHQLWPQLIPMDFNGNCCGITLGTDSSMDTYGYIVIDRFQWIPMVLCNQYLLDPYCPPRWWLALSRSRRHVDCRWLGAMRNRYYLVMTNIAMEHGHL